MPPEQASYPKRDTKNYGKARAETPPSLASALSSLICKRTLFLAHDTGQSGHRRQTCQQSPSLTAVGNQKYIRRGDAAGHEQGRYSPTCSGKGMVLGGDSSCGSGPSTQGPGLALRA